MSTFRVDKLYWDVNSQEWSFSKCFIQYDAINNTIGQDYNVSSYVDNGTGIQTHNFDKAFNTADYCVGYCCNEGVLNSDAGAFLMAPATPWNTYPTLTTAFSCQTGNQSADAFGDAGDANIVITEWGGS